MRGLGARSRQESQVKQKSSFFLLLKYVPTKPLANDNKMLEGRIDIHIRAKEWIENDSLIDMSFYYTFQMFHAVQFLVTNEIFLSTVFVHKFLK